MPFNWGDEIDSVIRGPKTVRPVAAPRVRLGTTPSSWADEIDSAVRGPELSQPEPPGAWEQFKDNPWPTVARIGLPIAGAAIGSVIPVAGTAAGAAIGAAAGGALGGAAGEALGEHLEGRELDPTEIAISGALGAIPAGPAGKLAATPGLSLLKRAGLHAAEGATQGLLGEGAHSVVREGRLPTMDEATRGLATGAVLGGALGTGLDVAGRSLRGTPRVAEPDAPWPQPVPPDAEISSGLRRPSFLDEGLDPDLPPGPALGYGRGGKPVEPVPAPLGSSFDDILGRVDEPPPVPENPAVKAAETELAADADAAVASLTSAGPKKFKLRDLSFVDEAEREPVWQRLKQSVQQYEADPNISAERAMEAALADLPPQHRQAFRDQWIGLSQSRAYGRDYLDDLRSKFNPEGPEGAQVEWRSSEDPEGTYYVVQRARNPETGQTEIVGGGLTIDGERAYIVGGDKVMDSPVSAGPVYKLMGRESETTSPAGQAAQENFRSTQRPQEPTFDQSAIRAAGPDSKPVEIVPPLPGEGGAGPGRGVPPALDQPLARTGEAGIEAPRQEVSRVVSPDTTGPLPSLQDAPSVDPNRYFNRDAAVQRLQARGGKINDLGSATAEGAGAVRDLVEVGASYVEDYARRNRGKLVSFESWANAVLRTVRNVVPNIRKHLRSIYDQAVALWNKTGVTFGALPNEPRGTVLGGGLGGFQDMVTPPPPPPGAKLRAKPIPQRPIARPVPDVAPAAPPTPPAPPEIKTQVSGRPVRPGESPRVEGKVENVREVSDAPLSREQVRTHESIAPDVQSRLRDITTDPKAEASLYNRAATGKLDDVDVQTLDAVVAGKRQTFEEARTKLAEAQAAGRDTGPENVQYLQAALDQVAADYARAARSDVEAGTKLARALAARARVMEAAGKSVPDQFLKRIFREIPGVTDQQAGELLRVMQDNPGRLQDALHAAMTPGLLDKVLEAWKSGLVSGLPTQGGNIIGNVGETLMRLGETVTASALDPVLGGPRTRLSGEAKYELRGAGKGAVGALGQLGTDLKDILRLAPEKIDVSQPLERQIGAISGKKGRAVRIPFRLLGAFDNFFKSVGREAELHKRAYRRANGNAKAAEAIIKDPPADLVREVETAKQSRVFQDPNKAVQLLQQLRTQHKWLHVVMPFLETPTNIAKITLQRSPLGFYDASKAVAAWKKAVKSGAEPAEIARLKGEAVDKIARPLMGTAIIGTFVAIAKSGHLTGSGPVDPKDKKALQDQGWQPYSLKFERDGKQFFIPINRFEPASSLLGFAADLAEAPDAKTGNDIFAKGVGSVIQNLFSKTYLQGIADAAEVVKDPMGSGAKYVSNLAGSVVPTIVSRGAQAIDPTVRDTKPSTSGLMGLPERAAKTVASRLPFVSSTLPAMRSGTGEVVERPGNPLVRFASPVNPTQEKEGLQFAQKLVDIEAVPTAPRKTVKVNGQDVQLTSEEYAIIQKADEETTKNLKRMERSLSRLPEDQQKRYIDQAYNKGRSQARSKLLASPLFRRRATAAMRTKKA
jgi:hypothetical protein